MKKILLAFVFGMITLSVFPQKKVSFLDNEPWEKVLKQAQKAQKMVFVDCYTSWCVPCKHLMNVIFPQKIVSDYLDSMFVCVKYDIEKENGKAFEDQYPNKILAVPTMFVTDSHGNLLHVLRGAREADDLLDNLKKGLLGKPLYEIEKEYRQGNRELDLVKRYLWFFECVGDQHNYAKVAGDYAAQFPMDSLWTPDIWGMVGSYIWRDPYSREFRFILEHLEKFGKVEKDYYKLENLLYERLRFETTVINLKMAQTENPDSLLALKPKVDQLLEASKYPVKEFPKISAELLVIKAMLDEDTDKVYERFMVFENCNFLIDVPLYRATFFRYLFTRLTDKSRMQACMDRLLAYQRRLGHEGEAVDDVVALGKEKLANM